MEPKTVINVAIADDHTILRESIATVLALTGNIEVIMLARDGFDLIQQLTKAPSLPDVCIIDIQMPIMNGFDTALNIRKQWPNMRMLALSAFDNLYHVLEMLQNGAGGFLTKDCKPEELQQAIISIHEIGCYYSGIAPKKIHTAVKNKELENPHLTKKEKEVLQYICTSKSYKEIADTLKTTTRSIEGLRDSLFNKFQVHDRAALAVLAYHLQLTYANPGR